MAYIGKSPTGTGVRSRFYYTQTSGGGTSISGTDDNSKTLTFTDGEYIDVYLNGVLLVAGTDYNTNTANTISGLAALANGDVVEVVVYDIFTVADTVSASSGGTFNAAITANQVNADNLRLDGNTISSTDTNGDITLDPDGTGDTIIASGNLGIGDSTPIALLTAVAADGVMADQYVAKFINSEATTGQNYGVFVAGGSSSADESFGVRNFDSSATYFLVRGDGKVGIGTSSPAVPLDVRKNNPSSGRLALFGSNGTPYTSKVSAIANALNVGRCRINVPANTTTQLVNGYGGSVHLISLLPDTGVADIQYTFLVTHGWNAATVLFTNTYGANTATFTFGASSGNLTVNHNHSGAINFSVATMVVSGPSSG